MSRVADWLRGGGGITGLEVIGHLRPIGEPTSADVMSRFYDSAGNTLDYVYELADDTLTIWGGAKGTPAYYRGASRGLQSLRCGCRVLGLAQGLVGAGGWASSPEQAFLQVFCN
ncbi:hypothetical protein [Micromonospora sp. ATCC 39149]|uniref:Uncharacterized protein n=1 Tax=Micromonospora carbonacea TaxID=47853 RepID=A0A7D5Y670_9ACTN|nr:hypothetical protein [Micromonospora sp. ATCC 39149]QLJ96239.1 hypothetical protein HZU44_27655 [Micromonospora carbonacea]